MQPPGETDSQLVMLLLTSPHLPSPHLTSSHHQLREGFKTKNKKENSISEERGGVCSQKVIFHIFIFLFFIFHTLAGGWGVTLPTDCLSRLVALNTKIWKCPNLCFWMPLSLPAQNSQYDWQQNSRLLKPREQVNMPDGCSDFQMMTADSQLIEKSFLTQSVQSL